MTLPIAILAGGLATRLRPITQHIPKSLVDVVDRPFAEHQIELLREHGVTDVVFLLGHLGRMVEEALGDGSRFGVRIRYVFDGGAPLGTGGAVRQARPLLGPEFFVLYGDSYLECDYQGIARAFAASGKAGLMTVCRNEDRWDTSNVLLAEDGRILRYDKRQPSPGMRHIDYGLGVFRAAAFDCYDPGTPIDLAVVYQDLLARGELAAFEVAGRFYEIGSPSGLEETRAHVARKRAPPI